MTKLQKLLFTLLIAGSTQGWASEEIDFSSMDPRPAQAALLKVLAKNDVGVSKQAIKRFCSQRVELLDEKFTMTAMRNVDMNQELIALLRAKGVEEIVQEEVMSAVSAPATVAYAGDIGANESKAGEVQEDEVRAPIPVMRGTLVDEEGEYDFDFEQARAIGAQEGNEYNNNVFSSAMGRGDVWKALEFLSASSTRPQLHILKHVMGGASEYVREAMVEAVGGFNIPQDYLNVIYGIDDSVPSSSSVAAVAQHTDFGFDQGVDPEFQAEIDGNFSMAIYGQTEMVEMYLDGVFGCVPSRSVVENTLATLRREEPSSALIELLVAHLKN